MKSPIAFAIVGFSIGIISHTLAGPAPVSGGSTGITTQPIGASPTSTSDHSMSGVASPDTASSGTGSTGAAPAAGRNENNTDEKDDTLYRGKTSESENPMLRDEGPLHFKTRPKEKIQEVDSLKNLQSSGTDPKFQGSLLNSDINALYKISEKANETQDPPKEGGARFKANQLSFTSDKNDEPKRSQSDSSPSPTPSPTTSPAAKNLRGTKP